MKLYFFTLWMVFVWSNLAAQVVTTLPAKPKANDAVTLTFHADQGSKGLMNYTGDVYAHTGLITHLSTGTSDWKYVQAAWAVNLEKCKLTRMDANTYTLVITPDIIQYYGVAEDETILQLAVVFRNADGSKTGKETGDADIFIDLDLSGSSTQVVSSEPETPTLSEPATLYFYADKGSQGLKDYAGDIYAHTGVITESSSNGTDWKYVIADWDVNIPKAKLTRVDANTYKLNITPTLKSYYNVQGGDIVKQLAFVFRNEDGSKTGKDVGDANIFVDVTDLSLGVKFVAPEKSPWLVHVNETVTFHAEPNKPSGMVAKINGAYKASNGGTSLIFSHTFTQTGRYTIHVEATAEQETANTTMEVRVTSPPKEKPLPQGVKEGINYDSSDKTKVTLALYAPHKKVVHYLGEQNNFLMDDAYQMYKDGDTWWITLENLQAGKEYAYQYLVDGELTIADPYAEKVLDPWNDSYIPTTVYPNLKPYPTELTQGIVSVYQTAQQPYQWKTTNFTMPDIEDLVIYELHIRDFDERHSIKAVEEKLEYLRQLGVNAIELLPFNEFEGNSSWGYNPSFYFATDKYYGTKLAYQQFIDKAHEMGMAVIMDMVLNHSFGQHPLVQLYFDANAGTWGQPTAENPWYNPTSPNTTYSWGYDFNHEAPATKAFVDRVVNFWLTEFKLDGFRYDFTKGFTNTVGDGGAYDASRIAILKRIYDVQMAANPNSLMICEHFTDNKEEQELSDYGMLIWGNLSHSFAEASMGYTNNSDLSWGSYKQRGYTKPHLVTYSESHDEERMLYRNLNFGASMPPYDIRHLPTALDRAKLSALFLLTLPGPKMLWQFQELGYDYSINTCPDGSVPDNDNCRTAEKPVHWEYTEDRNRRELYNTFSQLAALKQKYPIFSTPAYTTDLGPKAVKQIVLNLQEERAIVAGNFGLSPQTVQVDFTKKGWWYAHFSGDSIQVTTTGVHTFTFKAGEYELYATQKFENNNWPLSNTPVAESSNGIHIYPNPATAFMYVQGDVTNAAYQIYNQLGVLVQSGDCSDSATAIDISRLPAAMYVVRVTKADKTAASLLCIQR